MIVRLLAMGLVLVSAILLETVVFSGAAVAGQVPAIVVLSVIAFALYEGAETGARYGFAAGLAVDLVSGGLVGLSALILLLTGYTAGALRPYLTGSPLTAQLLLGGMGSAAAALAYGLLAALLDPQGVTLSAVVQGTVVTGLYSALVAPFVIRPIGALSRRLEAVATV